MSQQDVARHLAQEGATLVMLGMPPGTEFGIDVNFWNVGERFRGVKMIPPGLHFVYFSAVSLQGDTAPRTGFFHFFRPREVVVRHYDPVAEDLKVEEPNVDEVERIRSNLQQMDRFLGPYPLESWRKWISLTQHVEEAELKRMIPLSGRVCSAAELMPVAGFRSSKTHRYTHSSPSTSSQPSIAPDTAPDTAPNTAPDTVRNTAPNTALQSSDTTKATPQPTTANTAPSQTTTDLSNITGLSNITEASQTAPHSTTDPLAPQLITSPTSQPPTQPPPAPQLPEMKQKEGTMFRFTQPPNRAYREGASPGEVTKYSLDSSYSLKLMIGQVERLDSLVAELQVAFVSFLVAQVWDGWEQWRCLVGQLCRAEEVLLEEPQLYVKLLSVLHYQVNEIPEDLFVDIVESNNFLASALTTLFANIEDNAARLPPALVLKARRFKNHLSAKFEWDLTLGDEGEYAPVVVDVT
ncbi:protein AAR2 homolog isoform X1 [Scylla paramamosain]